MMGMSRGLSVWRAVTLGVCVGLVSAVARAESVRGVTRVQQGQAQTGPSLSQAYGKSHALLIGVSDYQHKGWDQLPSIPGELASVRRVLEKQGFEVQTLSNLGGRELVTRLSDFVHDQGFDENNRLLVYFSGHGETIELTENRPMGYFVPADAPPYSSDQRGFVTRALSMNRVMSMAKEIRAKHALFVFDSCFSGSIFQSRSSNSVSGRSLERLLSKPVRYFITSGSANETVPAVSAFTQAFIDSFEEGSADLNNDGYVTSTELGLHLTQNVALGNQTPQHGKIRDYNLSQGDVVFRSLLVPETVVETVTANEASPDQIREEFRLRAELLYWESLQAAPSEIGYREYLRKYPDGQFVILAQRALQTQEPVAPAPAVAAEPKASSIRVAIAPTKILGAAMHWEVNFSSEREVTSAVQRVMQERLNRHGLEPQLLSRTGGSRGWLKRGRNKYGLDRELYRDQTTEQQGMIGVVVRMRDDNSAGELQFVLSSSEGEKFSKRFHFQGESGLRRAVNSALDQVFEPALEIVKR